MNEILSSIRENWFLITFFAGVVYGWAELKWNYKYLNQEVGEMKKDVHEIYKILINKNKHG